MQKTNKKEVLSKSLTIGQELLGVNESHRAIISEFYANGFNKRAAVSSINPELSVNSANVTANYIFNHPDNQAYIKDKQRELKESTGIESIHVIREVINWIYFDATEFMELSAAEIKQLPSELRRCIQDFTVKTRKYYDKQLKEEVTEEVMQLKFVSKEKGAELMAKHLGIFDLDNKQKANNINVLQILQDSSPEILNGLLQAMQQNTIDQ